jgi:hypothetical protein
MKNRHVTIVLTTINAGDVLDGYCQQADTEGVRDYLHIIVIPDRKTPAELSKKCEQGKAQGFDIQCPTVCVSGIELEHQSYEQHPLY